jgi:hypothetical protein
LENGGFEEEADGKAKGWRAYGAYECVEDAVKSGARAVRCETRDIQASAGVMQEIVYDRPDQTPVLFGGWSKAEGVTAGDYCIYLDVWYEGGGNAWGVTANWAQPSHDWEYAAEVFYPKKPIRKIQYFVFLRRGVGRVWFDDLSLERRAPDLGVKMLRAVSDFPRTPDGVLATVDFWKRAAWRCRVTGADGRERAALSGSGTRAVVTAEGGPGVSLHVSARAGQERFEHVYPLPALPKAGGGLGKPVVWTADSMRCVTPLTRPSAAEAAAPAVALELARNECESAQILVTAGDAGPAAEVTVEVTAFAAADGRRFDGDVTWQRVGYVRRQRPYQTHPCGVPAEENWLPDPLLPPAPFTVRASATQGVWLTARANGEARPGV